MALLSKAQRYRERAERFRQLAESNPAEVALSRIAKNYDQIADTFDILDGTETWRSS